MTSLPRSRPVRRSSKRGARPSGGAATSSNGAGASAAAKAKPAAKAKLPQGRLPRPPRQARRARPRRKAEPAAATPGRARPPPVDAAADRARAQGPGRGLRRALVARRRGRVRGDRPRHHVGAGRQRARADRPRRRPRRAAVVLERLPGPDAPALPRVATVLPRSRCARRRALRARASVCCAPAAASTGGALIPPLIPQSLGAAGYGEPGTRSVLVAPTALVGEIVTVRGTFPGAARRRVLLQRLDPRRGWRTVARTRVRSTTRLAVRWRADRSGRIPLRVVRARRPARRAAGRVCQHLPAGAGDVLRGGAVRQHDILRPGR